MHAVFLSLALLAHPTVTETAILGHAEPVPRLSAFYPPDQVLIVPTGQTITLPPTFDYKVIEVQAGGRCVVSRTHDTTGRVLHLQTLPEGTFDAGTPADPIENVKVDIQIANVPLATGTVDAVGHDPYQVGNGIINFGRFLVCGRSLGRSWTVLAKEVPAGATTIEFAEFPPAWRVGDELLLPDTRQPGGNIPIRMESPVTIAAIAGNVVTLSKPVDFEHLAARDPDTGAIKYLPYVANLTRNIVFRSEDPSGTRGHIIHLEQGYANRQWAAFVGLGRTQATNLDSTTSDAGIITKIGTNQIARYADHEHHVHGFADADGWSSVSIGCLYDGLDGSKWGAVQHGTHDVLRRDNVGLRFVGAAFVTEDGYETRGTYERNLGAYCKGNGVNGKFNFVAPRNIPGGEGSPFWFHSMADMTIRENVGCCSAMGYQFLYRNQVEGRKVPTVPGGANDRDINPRTAVPKLLEDNVAFGNKIGIEQWNNPPLNHVRFTGWHNSKGIVAGNGEGGSITATDVQILQTAGDATSSSAAYTGGLSITGGEIITSGSAIHEVRSTLSLKDVTIQAGTGLNYHFFRPERTVLDGVLFKQYPGQPERHIVLGQQPPNDRYIPAFRPNDGKRFIAKNWQRQGQDYLIFEEPSLRSKPALAKAGERWSPVAGKTSGEVWDLLGVGYYGGVVADADAVQLPGLIRGVGKLGLDYPLGPPRVVVYSPSALAPTVPLANGLVRVDLLQTGSDQTSRLPIPVQVDGGTIHRLRLTQGLPDSERLANLPLPTTEGTHEIVTWREDASGNEIAGSRLVSSYYIGAPSTPPVDPDPPVDPPPADPTIAQLTARVEQLEREVLALLERIVGLENFRRDVKAAGE